MPSEPEPTEYTIAGSPLAVLRARGSNNIEVLPLPCRTLDGSLQSITLAEAQALMNSLAGAIDEEV